LKKLLTFAAIGETATGLALLIVPSLVVWLLFDAEIVGAAVIMSRLAGVTLIKLGVACWPGPPLIGMLTYSVLAMLYLTYIGVRGEWIGPLLWPAVVVHLVLNAASRAGLVQAIRGRISLTNPVGILSPCFIPFRTRHACHHSCRGSRVGCGVPLCIAYSPIGILSETR
jgi:hypothetical protein